MWAHSREFSSAADPTDALTTLQPPEPRPNDSLLVRPLAWGDLGRRPQQATARGTALGATRRPGDRLVSVSRWGFCGVFRVIPSALLWSKPYDHPS